MDCFCGCGTKVRGDLISLNARAGEVALELLAWDKYRTTEDRDPADALEIEGLIERGAACFGRVLSTIHGGREIQSPRESDEWLKESRVRWSGRPEMTEKGTFLGGRKLRVTEADIARLDRVHPDRSFSATTTPRDGENDTHSAAATDLAGQLERLGALRTEGVLSEEEFRAAKARVLGTARPPAAG
ncbi:MAG TPA: SHOCT domain-containing protein [Solirubrobacterales bacterium]